MRRTECDDHDGEHRRDHPQADRHPQEIAQGDVARRQWRRVHRVERSLPVEAADDRERCFERGGLHHGRREQSGGEELEIGEPAERRPAGTIDVAAKPEAHRGQEEDRAQERAECRRTEGPPVLDSPMFGYVAEGRHRYSIRERPVSRRKTSSSVERRTRTVSGLRPRSCAATATASPSSAYSRTRSASRSIRSARPSSFPSRLSWTSAGKRSSVTYLGE